MKIINFKFIRSALRRELALMFVSMGSIAIGLTFVSVGVFLCQFLPMPFLYIGLCVLSSFTFGFFQSFVPLYFGTISGMIAVWIVCLTSLRPWLMSQISHLDAFRHVHRELDAHQWKIVLILRLSPIPVGLQNFVLSLILSGGDAFWRYMVGSCCIVLPETLVYMAIGGTIKDVSEFVLGEATPTPWESGLMALQMLGAVCFLAGIITIGSRLVKDVYANLSENESCELPLPANSATQAIPRRKHMCDDIF
eukprot:TRINITY_DN7675_c0_g1_i2.p1 TRINITY_DN7675_c0_g1~~TRINITY_DN7675_c0_g1_i2.p1  ORF type:complete len:251 (+),score=44.84 TRINITY_DN7675_c0_g1_i2:120-872(+)